MKRIISSCIFLLIAFVGMAQYSVSGGMGTPYAQDPERGTGIEKIYLLNSLGGATITYTTNATRIRFFKYVRSLADKTEIPSSDIAVISSGGNSTTYQISNLEDSRGYLAQEDGNDKSAIWIIDYSLHLPELRSIVPLESEDRCQALKLVIDKSDNLLYYANNGAPKNITRLYRIEFKNVSWSEQNMTFVNVLQTSAPTAIGTEFILEKTISSNTSPSLPLIDTQFTLSGDQFAEHFRMVKKITSSVYTAISTEGHIETEITEGGSNKGNEDGAFAAPATIQFTGHGNAPTAFFYIWRIYHKSDMRNPIVRLTDQNIRFTFDRAGEYEIQLETADRNSICADTAVYTFAVSETFLDVPNFFSPGGSTGVNDEFRVAHRSVLNFKCSIFNRWGNKLYEFTDPNTGWDGTYGGKYVNPGVYFYVIEYEDTEGKKLKKAGDINIVRGR